MTMNPLGPAARPRQAVILVGNHGSHLIPTVETRPPDMVGFRGKPFLEYIVEMLRDEGFERILMLLADFPEVVRDHFGDGSALETTISYSVSGPDDLTVRRMRLASAQLERRFLLLHGDTYWPLQMDRLWEAYVRSGAPALVTVVPHAVPADQEADPRGGVIVDEEGFVMDFGRTPLGSGQGGAEIGYAILPRAVLGLFPEGDGVFEEAVYRPLLARRQLAAYVSGHRSYGVNSPERLSLTDAFLARRPAVILDRDGVLNERPPGAGYVTRPEDFMWLPGALEALRLLHKAGYRVLVATNQSGIGRGAMSIRDLESVHTKLVRDVEEAGGHIEAIYHCPHGPEEGCDCRKPKPGLLFRAQRDHNLDLTRTFFIGDDERDGRAASVAGCRWALATGGTSLLELTRQLLDGRLEG